MAPPLAAQSSAEHLSNTPNSHGIDKHENFSNGSVQIGPELTKTPLDHKLYRQILLPNGLWCILIQDTLAMHQNDGVVMSEDDDDDDEEWEDVSSNDNEDTCSREDEKSRDTKSNDEEDDDNSSEGDDLGIRDAAAALLVGVGSAYDPIECQGMAHFLEHLLFMGSEKYPGENEFSAYCSKHGGSDNAWTAFENTVYHVSIPQEFLWGALDRLVQHFISPLLLESAVDRELKAIESEFQLNKPSDECRRAQLQAATSKIGHVFSKFGWGNLRSLKEIPQRQGQVEPLQELRKFFERYYYAANMRLVVMGAFSLDQLQTKVQDLFGSIAALPRQPNEEYPLPIDANHFTSWDTIASGYNSPLIEQGMPWDQERSLSKIFRIVPTKEKHRLVMTWPIPSLADRWKGKPHEFIAHLLGHEGSGSLLSYFRKQSWATSCVAGMGDDEEASPAWLFSVSFELSEDGLQHWKTMVDAVFVYVGMLRQYTAGDGCWPEWIFSELQQMEHVNHQYGDEEAPEELVSNLVEHLAPHLRMPPERILDGFGLLWEFDTDGISDLLDNYLSHPNNMRIDISSSQFGSYADMDVSTDPNSTDMWIPDLMVHNDEPVEQGKFDPSRHPPQVEPNFETLFWVSHVPKPWLQEWANLAQPSQPTSLPFHLPPPNPYVPERYDMKELPIEDSHHPLLNATLKICTAVGKVKQWFTGTVLQYDRKKNEIKVAFEDHENQQWHKLDLEPDKFKTDELVSDFEGSLDNKASKFRVISLALPGVTRKYGDESDFDISFPPLPPALPPSRLPKELSSTNQLRMWFLQDRNFHRPIADFRLQIICKSANVDPKHRACAELFSELLHDACLETTYMANMAGLSFHIETTCLGFTLRFHGFDNKLLVLFEQVFQIFLSFRGLQDKLPDGIPDDRFDYCLELLRRKYTNMGMYSSDMSSDVRLQAIRQRLWSSTQRNEALEDLTISKFALTLSEILDTFAIESLLHGNFDTGEAKAVQKLVQSLVASSKPVNSGLKRQKYPLQSILRVPEVPKHSIITVPSKNSTEANTSVELYLQVGKDNMVERVLIDVLVHLMDDPIFDQIRTKDQYGYEVFVDSRWSSGVMGIMFRVVSNVKSAHNILERIDRFLVEFRRDTLEPMTDDDFLENLVAVSTEKLDMFNSMHEETDSYWDEIVNGRFQWQVSRDEAAELRKITKQDILLAFDKWLNPKEARKILAVQVIGYGEGEVSNGRPEVPAEQLNDFVDGQIHQFHQLCKHQMWGRVNSKLA